MKVTATIPRGVINVVDQHVKDKEEYSNRSIFITEACKEKVAREQGKE